MSSELNSSKYFPN